MLVVAMVINTVDNHKVHAARSCGKRRRKLTVELGDVGEMDRVSGKRPELSQHTFFSFQGTGVFWKQITLTMPLTWLLSLNDLVQSLKIPSVVVLGAHPFWIRAPKRRLVHETLPLRSRYHCCWDPAYPIFGCDKSQESKAQCAVQHD